MQSLEAAAGPEFDGARLQLGMFLTDEGSVDPAIVAQNREVGEIVVGALGKLDEQHRTVVVLRDIEGMSYAEIAETLEIELGTVKSRLSRARANLREILETVLI